MDIRQRLLAIFQVEHAEHVVRIRAFLDGCETRGCVSSGPELDEAFRGAHSLKGAARAVDLAPVEALAHGMESLFARVREGSLALGAEGIRAIRRALDASEDVMAAVAQGATPEPPEATLRALDAALSGSRPAPAAPPAPSAPLSVAEHQPAPEATAPVVLPAGGAAPESVRVSVDTLDRVLRSAAQLSTETLRQELVTEQIAELQRRVAAMEASWEQMQRAHASTLRKLYADPEYGAIGAYLEGMARQLHAVSGDVRRARFQQRRTAWDLRQLGEQLQEDIREARLVPAESVLGGFRKMMRDLARDAGREIDFRISGLQTQADRVVLQELKDPLMHLLRNTLSHGVEPPEERERAGKPRAGRVELRIEARGSRLCLVVEDDGCGLNRDGIAAAAQRAGLLTPEQADAASLEELAPLIFHPGLSTAGAVNDLSGRGMGLSVVQQVVAQLQGEVEAAPSPNGGARFTLSVPISISTHAMLLVRCGEETYGIPSSRIERLHRVRYTETYSLEGTRAAMVDDQPLSLAGLGALLGLPDGAVRADGEFLTVVVLTSGRERLGVVVDGLVRHTEAVIRDLGPQFAGLPSVAGGIILGDGEIALALHPPDLFEAFHHSRGSLVLSLETPEREAPPASIMVVDDSITTRTLEKSILEAHGYRVRVAVDGAEAYSQLQAEPADLIVSDIEMPRMDGFALLEAVRCHPRLKETPLILVTSLEKREHKERGLALGADAYVVKRSFEQTDLLETIRQLL